ncbi:hypothetical protein MS3_00000483 [Schistosoma haematobium]|uniref:Uncharacterized protein n=1 Tax=Schistosoma haematobium TaxID=6185 RepID=A0A922LTH5_SCHHA|nr:hypothetical protein MS3_00000483 [Schistosoma haematobium]KAH9593637.1 hypothetical protein MS3_00000483 [Schistosoma haematobium]
MRLEKLYGAKWILDLFKNINPNDANSLQTYSENYERLSDIKSNPDLDEYSQSLIESAIEKKWNARLNFDLATNTYLNMKPSSKSSSLTENNRKSLDERKSTLGETENQYKESKLRLKRMYREMVEAGHSLAKVYANPEVKAETAKYEHAFIKYLSELNDHLKTLTNMEVQRIDVLELLSLEERIKIYESIMQEESKYSL